MAEPPHPNRSEWAASWELLRESVRGGLGLVLISAALAMLAVYYHRWLPVDLGLVGYDWGVFGWVGLSILCLLVVPVALIVLVLRESVRDYGLTLGEWRVWLRHGALYLSIVLPVIMVASRFPAFRQYYPMFKPAVARPILLVPWELAYGAYFLAWEFFFRGYLLRSLARPCGPAAIAIQTVPFVLMHFGKPEPEVIASVIAGLALGVMAYRGRSVIGCWLLHWICAAAMDLLAVLL